MVSSTQNLNAEILRWPCLRKHPTSVNGHPCFELTPQRSSQAASPADGEVEEVQCSTMGVLAPLTGAIGAMQALEAVKLLAGAGETPRGQLTLIDAKTSELRSVRVKKDPACAVCAVPTSS